MKKLTNQQFIEKAILVHGNKFKYSFYINSRKKLNITCNNCGLLFKQKANNHLNGQGCPKCCGNIFPSTKEEFIEKARLIHGDKHDYSLFDYLNSRTKGIIKCNICSFEFLQRPAAHIQGQGCPKCKESLGERFISEILDKHNINYKREYKLPGTNYRFEYDFYLPDYNLLIEFHGIQHYEPVKYFGGEDYFKEILKRDIFKRELSNLVNIPLIEFNYKQLKELSQEQFENLVIKIVSTNRKRRKN